MLRYMNFKYRNETSRCPLCRRLNWEFVLLTEGRCRPLFPEQPHPVVKAPAILIFPPGHEHGWEPVQKCWRMAVFHFLPVPAIFESWMEGQEYFISPIAADRAKEIKKMAEETWAHYLKPNACSPLVYEKMICFLCQQVMESGPTQTMETLPTINMLRVQSVLNWYAVHLPENPKVDYIASVHHMTGANLRRLFHLVLGKNPKKVFDAMKVNRALEMMGGSSLTLQTIASECGFNDANELCRVFRREGKVAPTCWRKKLLYTES